MLLGHDRNGAAVEAPVLDQALDRHLRLAPRVEHSVIRAMAPPLSLLAKNGRAASGFPASGANLGSGWLRRESCAAFLGNRLRKR